MPNLNPSWGCRGDPSLTTAIDTVVSENPSAKDLPARACSVTHSRQHSPTRAGGHRRKARPPLRLIAAFALLANCSLAAYAASVCTGKGLEVQVLGSGGPEVEGRRASSSYLVWRDGHARVLVDAGGGASLRFGEAGARMEDIDVILLSHLHIDHTADFSALIKSSYFGTRQRALPVYGPGGNADFPATSQFVADLFDAQHGLYRYLGPYLSAADDGYKLESHDVLLGAHEILQVYSRDGLVISATAVIHGSVPALAWRIEADKRTVVFSGDGNGNNGNLQKLARGADLFVVHHAIPEGTTGAPRELHMPPAVIGEIARDAAVKQVILSHRMLRTVGKEAQSTKAIARSYAGPVRFADDLDCFQ